MSIANSAVSSLLARLSIDDYAYTISTCEVLEPLYLGSNRLKCAGILNYFFFLCLLGLIFLTMSACSVGK